MSKKKAGSPAKGNNYHGPTPTTCEICDSPMGDQFVDGKTLSGPWALMCQACHLKDGVGLGMGKGQKYDAKSGAYLEA